MTISKSLIFIYFLTFLLLRAIPAQISSSLKANEQENESPSSIFQEKYNSGWSFYLDNDAFSFLTVDRDYTGGFAVTLSGKRASEYFFSLNHLLHPLNNIMGISRITEPAGSFQLHNLEFGLTSFTPDNITESKPINNDHPYASLVFLANSRQSVIPAKRLSTQSTLTVGLLGTPLSEWMQTGIHNILNQQVPQGWHHQISDGGEPTIKYTFTLQKTFFPRPGSGHSFFELKTGSEASIGFTTDLGISMHTRLGDIHTPWWSFNPHQAEYINLGTPQPGSSGSGELYLWAGASLKHRLYNAILQGQFRKSDVTFNRSELNPWIAEAWAGITKNFKNGFGISFFIRSRNNEIKYLDSRNPIWGGFILRKAH